MLTVKNQCSSSSHSSSRSSQKRLGSSSPAALSASPSPSSTIASTRPNAFCWPPSAILYSLFLLNAFKSFRFSFSTTSSSTFDGARLPLNEKITKKSLIANKHKTSFG